MNKDEALRLALEALQFALHVGFDESSGSQIKKGDKAGQQHRQAITAIKAALEAKDEPSMKVEGPLHVICQCDKCKPQIAFNAEVVGYVAPQRTWVGLTQEEFEKLINDAGFTRSDLLMMGACIEQIVDLVEAKLKDKNNG